MNSWADRSMRALTVYLERGAAALTELEAQRFDEADELLRLRRAAFYNFRAADFLALREGYPEQVDAEIRVLAPLVEEQDTKLMAALVSAKEQLAAQLLQLSKSRAALKRYRSSGFEENSFEKSV